MADTVSVKITVQLFTIEKSFNTYIMNEIIVIKIFFKIKCWVHYLIIFLSRERKIEV